MEGRGRGKSRGAAAGARSGGARAGARGRGGGTRGGRGDRRGKGKRPARSPSGQELSSFPSASGGSGDGGGGGGGGAGGGAGGGDSYDTLGKLVSKATKPTRETGYKRLDEDTVRRIKGIARKDEDCAAGAIRYLMQRMAAKSAEVRFMALSIVGLLFQRSRVVRKVIVADLKNFMNLAVGHDARHPLPGPPAAAVALREKALALMEEWNESHGDLYKGLRAAYRFLREGKRMKFPELQARAARARDAAARRDKHARRLLQAKYLQAKAEITEQASEIQTIVREMDECFAILVPAVPGTDAVSTDQDNTDQGNGDKPRGDHSLSEGGDRVSDGGGGGGGGGGVGSDGGDGSKDGDAPPVLASGRDAVRSPQTPAAAVAASCDDDRRQYGNDGCGGGGGGGGSGDEGGRSDGSAGGVGPRSSGGRPTTDSECEGTEEERRKQESSEEGEGNTNQHDRTAAGESGREDSGVQLERGKNERGGGARANTEARDSAAATTADSDDDEGMEWEDGGGDNDTSGDNRSEAEEEEGEEDEEGDEEAVRNGKRRWSGGAGDDGELRTIADTVEAAGLGSSGYELQVEVPMGWSVTTGGSGAGEDAALVVSALRERYKVLTSRGRRSGAYADMSKCHSFEGISLTTETN
ncbi:conserved unknown protein [Ectocarpus siliculosus]|uniref:VHS domain-containing protein n=1 Tax=Ectocarpus siliculosus TaxID=2880 RepID=D8LTZ4_ECTSI|nr:conserved unknown protein [Ectocarpus siliculosus]|eukprot:CBN75384.1 conserved unknown protein [Ectocarpus siliculosus]